jgi:hypothetical protein
MKKHFKIGIVTLLILSLFTQCKKEGSGGKAIIRGCVVGADYSSGTQEITEVMVTQGGDIEHGDYWILNNATSETFYYIWYNNPTWISDGDPHLSGRTGIKVDFNYSDSNTDIAEKTVAAMQTVIGDQYTLSADIDIIKLISSHTAEISDADKGITNFNIDVLKQGKNNTTGSVSPVINQTVYLVYGDGSYFNETTVTGADGYFSFYGLNKGDYKVYTMSKNSETGTYEPIYRTININKRKSITETDKISVVY